MGINATRYFSLLYGTKLNVGRVMSPTLSLLVERESTISAFVPEDYYTVNLGFGEFNAVSERFPNKAEAEKLAAACQNSTAIVKKIHQQEKQESAPGLYDLTRMLTACWDILPSRRWTICSRSMKRNCAPIRGQTAAI